MYASVEICLERIEVQYWALLNWIYFRFRCGSDPAPERYTMLYWPNINAAYTQRIPVILERAICCTQDLYLQLNGQGQNHRSKLKSGTFCCVWAITLSCIVGFSYIWAQRFCYRRQCVASKTNVATSKVTISYQRSKSDFFSLLHCTLLQLGSPNIMCEYILG